jgi:hypothetical protein
MCLPRHLILLKIRNCSFIDAVTDNQYMLKGLVLTLSANQKNRLFSRVNYELLTDAHDILQFKKYSGNGIDLLVSNVFSQVINTDGSARRKKKTKCPLSGHVLVNNGDDEAVVLTENLKLLRHS